MSLRSSDILQWSKAGCCLTTSRLHLLIQRVPWRSWRLFLQLSTKKKAKKSKQNNPHLIFMISWRLPKILVCCKLVMTFLGSFLLQLLFMGSGGVAEISRDKCLDPCFFYFFFPCLCPCKGILGVHMCVWRWSVQTCEVTTSWICPTYCGIEQAYLNYFCYCWLMLSTSMENRG